MLRLSYSILIISWWICAGTILLPITICFLVSKTFGRKWVTFLFTHLDDFFQPPMEKWRKRAFQTLKKSLEGRDNSTPLEILEIGIGNAVNLPFYPDNCSLTVLDVNKYFDSYFWQNEGKYPHISYKGSIIGAAENMDKITDGSLDVVIGTYVLCSCMDPVKVVSEVKRVLKPDGKYLFLEHVSFQEKGWNLLLQTIINPLWRLYFCGCNLNRNSRATIETAGFSNLYCKDMLVSGALIHLYSPQIMGIALK